MSREPVVAGVDVGNATTEIVLVSGGRLVGADRMPTRGGKGSQESLRAAAALLRRLERRLGCRAAQARIAPLRAVETATVTIPRSAPATGRLRLLAAGVATPGGAGACVGVPLWPDGPAAGTAAPGGPAPGHAPLGAAPLGGPPPGGPPPGGPVPGGPVPGGPVPGGSVPDGVVPVVAVVPPGTGYADAARWLRRILAAGVPLGAVLVAGDEGVLVANRLPVPLPVVDQVDVAALAGCPLVAVEVRPPGQPLALLTDPVAVAAAFSLAPGEAPGAAAVCRAVLDCSNAVIGCTAPAGNGPQRAGGRQEPADTEPWLTAGGRRITLRAATAGLAEWPAGTVSAFGWPEGEAQVDDLFALDLAAVAELATARHDAGRRAALVAFLRRPPPGPADDHAGLLAELLERPVRCLLSEPAAARLGALTTPGARPGAVVVDLGAGTIDVIAPAGEVVAAGAGALLTAAVAATMDIPRAAADWVKRGPCLRIDTGQRFEAEDGSRGFLTRPAPASAVGMLAAPGPAGLLPFGRRLSPAEWRALRLRLKQAVFAVNLRRAMLTLPPDLAAAVTGTPPPGEMPQVLIVGGPAGDDELLGVLARTLPPHVSAGRANVGGTLAGASAGHRYAAALGLALASD
jgi:diol dehydratase reactivase ATPase-like protein/cobalamin-dependent diol dehydratase reactivating factor